MDTAKQDEGRAGRRQRAGWVAVAITTAALVSSACGGPASTHKVGSSSQSDSAELTTCMRAHGVKDFPKATSNGQFNLNGIDTNSEGYQSALNACKLVFANQNQAQNQAQALAQGLRYARCMRAHGLHSFPDPTVSGGTVTGTVSSGSGLGPFSGQFKAARVACRYILTQGGSQ